MRKIKYQIMAAIILALAMTVVVGLAAAQSGDPDKPTPMTTGEAKGRWAKDKDISHFYSFTAGPGEVKVLLYFNNLRQTLDHLE